MLNEESRKTSMHFTICKVLENKDADFECQFRAIFKDGEGDMCTTNLIKVKRKGGTIYKVGFGEVNQLNLPMPEEESENNESSESKEISGFYSLHGRGLTNLERVHDEDVKEKDWFKKFWIATAISIPILIGIVIVIYKVFKNR